MKKGELSINLIIMAVIAIVAIVVMLTIFRNTISNANTEMSDCEARGGDCAASCNGECYTQIQLSNCPVNRPICCIKMKECAAKGTKEVRELR